MTTTRMRKTTARMMTKKRTTKPRYLRYQVTKPVRRTGRWAVVMVFIPLMLLPLSLVLRLRASAGIEPPQKSSKWVSC
jgi:hypothetical protein